MPGQSRQEAKKGAWFCCIGLHSIHEHLFLLYMILPHGVSHRLSYLIPIHLEEKTHLIGHRIRDTNLQLHKYFRGTHQAVAPISVASLCLCHSLCAVHAYRCTWKHSLDVYACTGFVKVIVLFFFLVVIKRNTSLALAHLRNPFCLHTRQTLACKKNGQANTHARIRCL